MKFTVIGSNGFIGSALSIKMRAEGYSVFTPSRGDDKIFSIPLNHVIYAAGVTSNFRLNPFNTLQANTSYLAEILEKSCFDSLLYLSSSRIYRHAESTQEDAAIFLKSYDPEDLYDLTKLTAEALCYAREDLNHKVKVVRLSNVIGTDFRSQNFLFDIIRSACDDGVIYLRSSLDSCKDYVMLEDVIELLPKIATIGKHKCYNVASGHNLTHQDIVNSIIKCTKARLEISNDTPTVRFSRLDVSKILEEFTYKPSNVLDCIPRLVLEYKNSKTKPNINIKG
jgi:nucleoside-diphosphate-sugar epimerase